MSRTSAIRVVRTTSTKATSRKPKKQTKAVSGVEVRSERFRQLALKRVPRALHGLQLIENLASHNYKYTPEQADKIIRALEEGLQKVRDAFNKPKKIERVSTFEL